MAKSTLALGRILLGYFCQAANVRVTSLPLNIVRVVSTLRHNSAVPIPNLSQPGRYRHYSSSVVTLAQVMEEQKQESPSSPPPVVVSLKLEPPADEETEVNKTNESAPVSVSAVRPPRKKKAV